MRNKRCIANRRYLVRHCQEWRYDTRQIECETPTYDTYWYYDLTNITADHIINVTAGGNQPKLWFKDPSWTQAIKAWKKVNGTWVEQSDLTTVFQSGVNYRKGN